MSHLVPILNKADKNILIHIKNFTKKAIQPFIIAMTKDMEDTFSLTKLPVVNSFLKLHPQGLSSAESTEFPTQHMMNTR